MIPTISPKTFALGGNATFTLVSKKTGNRFTFRVRKGKQPSAPHFVSLMNGPDNERNFEFLGTIFGDGRNFVHGKKSRISREAPSARAFAWLWDNVTANDVCPASAEFHHEGKCCCCGRKLTVPESIVSGIGPECAKKHAV